MNKIWMLTIVLALLTNMTADAQWRSKTHDVYNAPGGIDVTIDGDLNEWAGMLEAVTGTDGTPFCGLEYDGNVFQAHGGGKWTGADDHETCFMITWDENAVYLALIITDDEHEHAAAPAWNGDGVQLAFEMSGERTPGQQMFLYNVALDDKGQDILLEALNENPGGGGLVPGDDIAVIRDEAEKKTYYELRFTAEELQVNGKKFSEGLEFGLGICVNDGDKGPEQAGQKGWSGWYTHAVVFGKNSEHTGLVVLTSEELAVKEDVTRDGVVNIQDLVFVASNLGESGDPSADVNKDGVVNIQDLVLVAGAFD